MENVGRNDPCPCGSGKKFKKCCMNKSPLQRRTATVITKDGSKSSTIAKISKLSNEQGVVQLFKKAVVPQPSETAAPAKSLKGKVSVGNPTGDQEKSN